MLGILIQANAFQNFMRGIEYRAARRFVHAAALHADKAVFHHVADADAVRAADLVEFFDDLYGRKFLSVYLDGNALFKSNGHIGRLIGRLLGRYAEFQNFVVFGLVGGIFQIHALVREVPQVFILGIVGLLVIFKGILCASA